MLPIGQIFLPVSYGQATVGYPVTFPTFCYQSSALTDFHQPQTSLHYYAVESSERTCMKCKLDKRDLLNRQVYELVKKYGGVEVVGREILGWYMLLSTEDRNFIKEYGSLTDFLANNPSLFIDNSWVHLRVGGHYHIMENPEGNEQNFFAHSETYEDTSTHFKEISREMACNTNNFCIDDFKQREGNQISVCQYTTHASLNLEHWTTPIESKSLSGDIKHMDFTSCSSPCSENKVSKETVVNLSERDPKSIGRNQIGGVGPGSFIKFPHCRSLYLQPPAVIFNCEESSAEKNGCPVEEVSKERFSSIIKPEQVMAEEEKQSVQNQWSKLSSDELVIPVEQEYSANDIGDDDTFLSIQSGIYSRSSSPFSFDDNTDAESCIYEEALEYLSTYSVYNQTNSQGPSMSTYAYQQHLTMLPSSHKISSVTEMKSPNQRERSCNTDLTCIISHHEDKSTQTRNMDTQNVGVNTDITLFGMVSPPKDSVNLGNDNCNDLDYKKGNKGDSSYPLIKALLQRVVKAEMQLVDVQRMTCWQLCWKAQQQYMEKQSLRNMHPTSADHSSAIMNFNLLSALAEVEEKYLEMKTLIQSGISLDDLVPLSMQLTKIESPGNLLNQCFTENFQCSTTEKASSDQHEDLQKTRLLGNNIAKVSLPDATKDQHNEERECKQSKKLSLEGRSYVHVGNVEPSVKEEDLRTAFQKFEVSEIFIEESSMTSSYALLIFICSERAQAAVKEMNGKLFWGKKLKVRHIQYSTLNFQFASEAFTTFSAAVCKQKTMVEIGKPKVFSAHQSPNSENFVPKPDTQNEVPKGSSKENMGGLLSSMLNEMTVFPNANLAFSKAPQGGGSTGLSTYVPSTDLSMLQSHHSNQGAYNSIPMCIPCSYPLHTMPGASSFSLQAPLRSPLYNPVVNMTSNDAPIFVKDKGSGTPPFFQNILRPLIASTGELKQYTKAGSSPTNKTPSKPVIESPSSNAKFETSTSSATLETTTSVLNSVVYMTSNDAPIFVKDKGSGAPPLFQNIIRPLSASTGELKYTKAGSSSTRKTPSKPVFESPSSNAQLETASLETTTSVLNTAIAACETTEATSLPPSYDIKTIGFGSGRYKPTGPLRLPRFVPESVTVPEESKTLVGIKPASDGVTKSSITGPRKTESALSEEMMWGVYPKCDKTSELPTFIIPNRLNLSQFKNVVNYLSMIHKNVTRDQIVDALEEVRMLQGGSLGSLTISKIISQVSSVLAAKNLPPA